MRQLLHMFARFPFHVGLFFFRVFVVRKVWIMLFFPILHWSVPSYAEIIVGLFALTVLLRYPRTVDLMQVVREANGSNVRDWDSEENKWLVLVALYGVNGSALLVAWIYTLFI